MNKTRIPVLLPGILILAIFAAITIHAQPFGQWDFDSGNLTATTGSDLQYGDAITTSATSFGSTTSFGIPNINGASANVMKFPGSTNATMGYNMPTPAANGRGNFVDNYTLIMDVLFPAASDAQLRSLLQADGGLVTPAADWVITAGNQLSAVGIGSGGTIAPNTWYRIGFVVQTNNIYGYVDGNQVFTGTASGGNLDRFDLSPSTIATILGDNTANVSAGGYVNSIQLRTTGLSEGEMAALGGAAATGIPATVPQVPSFIRAGRTPGVGAVNLPPKPGINIVLDQGSTIVDSSSIKLFMDGVLRSSAVVTPSAPTFTITDSITSLLPPSSVHNLSLVWSDSVAGLKTNTWSFTVVGYQSLKLPAAFYLEDFETTAEGALPDGWSVTNYTTPETAGLNLCDPKSDAYLNWVIINTNRLCGGGPCAGFECDALAENVYVINGVQIGHLANGKIAFAESDNRKNEPASQVNYLFTKDIDCTGKANVFVSWHSIYKQNQDSMGVVEYSVDQGANWLPVIYYLDDENGSADIIRTNGVIDVGATLGTPRTDQAGFYNAANPAASTTGLAYSNFVAAPIGTNLIPYIQGRINDDNDFDATGVYGSRRIELVRLPAADNAATVRFRFVQAGTCSWFFGIDELGLYEIGFPIIATQPQSQVRDAGTPVTFSVTASATPPPQYQWLFNGGAIGGATTSSYTFTAETNNAGTYSVIVSNSLDSVTSASATLTVIAAPKIILQPVSVSVNAGSGVGFSVAARGRSPIGYQWTKNGGPIGGATASRYVIGDAQLANDALYACVVSNVDSTTTSRTAYLKIVTNINQDLIVHLKFDNDYNDASGRGNNGTAVGSPGFVAGKIGQCMQYTLPDGGTNADGSVAQNYVTLDNPIGTHPADLRFVDSVSMSFSFWYKVASGNRNGDPPLISNKDWDSGSNEGIAVFNSGSGLRWNFREVDDGINSNTRKDSGGTSPGLEDNNWHHCVVVFNRGGNAGTYVDGNLVHVDALATPQPVAVGGFFDPTTIDNDPSTNRTRTATGAWNIGEDGSGLYTSTTSGHDGPGISVTNAAIDDLGIWRRALTPGEVTAIYTAGNLGNSLDTAAPVSNPTPLNPVVSVSGTNIVITKGNTMLFSAPTINGPWTEVTAARSVSAYSEPLGATKFYRGAQP